MAFLDNLTRKVTETAKTAAKKSGELVETTKISMAISGEEEKINKAYAQIGKDIYEAYAAGYEIPKGFEEKCLEIKSIQNEINSLKEKIAELKGIKYCIQCGSEMERNVVFCSKCGTKNEIPEPQTSEPEPPKNAVCSKCGATVSEGMVFCSTCGNKVG